MIALSPMLRSALQPVPGDVYRGDDEFLFCHPDRGTIYRAETFEPLFRRTGRGRDPGTSGRSTTCGTRA